jgi:predicted dehydrogenase
VLQENIDQFTAGEKLTRVALVGAGFIADFHVRALKSLPGASIVAVCDTDLNKARALQQRWGIAHSFGSIAEMRQGSDIDVVHILVPPPFHAQSLHACLEAGWDVFLEKPAVISGEECHEVLAATEGGPRTVGVNHNAPYHPAFLRAVDAIRRRRIGAVQHAVACLNVPLRQLSTGEHHHWMFQKPEHIILEQAPHPLSQIRFLLGEIKTVSSVRSGEIRLLNALPFYDTWQVSMLCERGSAQCFMSFSKGFWDSWIHIIGEDGVLFIDLRRNLVRISEKTRFPDPVDNLRDAVLNATRTTYAAVKNLGQYALAILGAAGPGDPFFSSIRSSIAAFHQARSAGQPAPVDLREGCAIIATCEQIAVGANGPLVGVSQPEVNLCR